MRKSLTFLVLFLVVASVGAASAADENETGFSCSYVESGPRGNEGNVLSINIKVGWDIQSLYIGQDGDEIQVGPLKDYAIEDAQYGSGLRHKVAPCSGPTPTVHNIDQIAIHTHPDYDLSLALDARTAGHDGFLAPGVTPEKYGSEIEIRADVPPRTFTPGADLLLLGGKGNDSFGLGSRNERVGVNLNVADDGKHPDADLLPDFQFGQVIVDLGAGSDHLLAGGEKGGLGRFDSFVRVIANGGPGNDHMNGHDGIDLMNGQGGSDVVRGGAGDDGEGNGEFGITGGKGNDRTYGGPGDDMMGGVNNATTDDGADYVYGGPGFDRFINSFDRRRDVIDCGGDRTGRLDYEKKFDQLRHCGRRH